MTTAFPWKCFWLLPLVAACESRPEVKRDGFLTQYYLLEERDGAPRPMWVNPNADFALYDRVLLDPVTVWGNDTDTLADAAPEQVRGVCGRLVAGVRAELVRHHVEVVRSRGPGVLRIRLAVTEAASSPHLVVTIKPDQDDAAIDLWPRTRRAVGPARIEAELSDSVTGELLCAAAQRLDASDGGEPGSIEQVIATWAAKLAAVVGARQAP